MLTKDELVSDIVAKLQQAAPAGITVAEPAPATQSWTDLLHAGIAGKPGDAIWFDRVGKPVLTTKMGIIGMSGGLLEAVERPLNGIIPNLHLGSVLVGGATGLVIGEIIDAYQLPKIPRLDAAKNPVLDKNGQPIMDMNITNLAIKGGAMFLLGMLGPKLMGGTGVIVAVGILGAQIVADILPLGKLVDWILKWFKKTPAPLAQFHQEIPVQEIPVNRYMAQGAATRRDMYAGIFG